MAELRVQSDRRHDMQRHRKAVRARDRRALQHEPGNAGDQTGQRTEKCDAPQQAAHRRRIAAGRQFRGREQQSPEQRHKCRDMHAAQQGRGDVDAAHALVL